MEDAFTGVEPGGSPLQSPVDLVSVVAALGVELDRGDVRRLEVLVALLQEWSARFNLTAIRDTEGILLKHIADSLAPAGHNWRAVDGVQPRTLLDVGSGAGFPALPLAMVYPETKVTALDPGLKKCEFIGFAAATLGADVRVVRGRAEIEGQRPVLREKFDLVLARAVAYLPALAEYCLPYTRVGGFFIAMKSESLDEEIEDGVAAVEEMGGLLREPIPYNIPGVPGTRWLVVAEKVAKTPPRYPRERGMPKRKPVSR